jgi:hypothetical protein
MWRIKSVTKGSNKIKKVFQSKPEILSKKKVRTSTGGSP